MATKIRWFSGRTTSGRRVLQSPPRTSPTSRRWRPTSRRHRTTPTMTPLSARTSSRSTPRSRPPATSTVSTRRPGEPEWLVHRAYGELGLNGAGLGNDPRQRRGRVRARRHDRGRLERLVHDPPEQGDADERRGRLVRPQLTGAVHAASVVRSSSSKAPGCLVTLSHVASTSLKPWRPGTLHFSLSCS